jgi:hypothetical protein
MNNINYNLVISKQLNDNMYFNSFSDKIDNKHYYEDVMFIDIWDIHKEEIIVNFEHQYFNEYIFDCLSSDKKSITKTYQTDNINTNDTILFYIVFDSIPNDIIVNGEIIKGYISIESQTDIIDKIKKTANVYKYAKILVVSNIFNYYTNESKETDIIVKSLKKVNNVEIDFAYNIDKNCKNIQYIFTNKVSNLFRLSVLNNIPIILHNKTNTRFMKYIEAQFNHIDDDAYFVNKNISNFEQFVTPMGNTNKMYLSSFKCSMNNKYKLMNILKKESTICLHKFHMYGEINMFKDIFQTTQNKDVINFTSNIDEKTMILSLKTSDNFNKKLKQYSGKYNIIIFDFDPFHKEQKIMRMFYMNVCNTSNINMYNFNNIIEICNKFCLPMVQPCKFNVNGKILVSLDNPYNSGLYENVEEWISKWQKVFDMLIEMNHLNLVIKPYKSTIQEDYNKLFYENFTQFVKYYDHNLINCDHNEYLKNNDDIFYCVKRNGSYFLQSFVHGKIMISGFDTNDLSKKPDNHSYKSYEYTLENIKSNHLIEFNKIKQMNNTESFEILKSITKNFINVDDIKNGTLYKNIIDIKNFNEEIYVH